MIKLRKLVIPSKDTHLLEKKGSQKTTDEGVVFV